MKTINNELMKLKNLILHLEKKTRRMGVDADQLKEAASTYAFKVELALMKDEKWLKHQNQK